MGGSVNRADDRRGRSRRSGERIEIVLEAGVEGGSVAIEARRMGRATHYRVRVMQGALIDAVDREGQGEWEAEQPWLASWEEALKRLDAYPWASMHPLVVAYNHAGQVLVAARDRLVGEERANLIYWCEAIRSTA